MSNGANLTYIMTNIIPHQIYTKVPTCLASTSPHTVSPAQHKILNYSEK